MRRSIRARICRRSVGVKWLSAICKMKYRACRVRRPPLLNSRCCELVSDQLSFVCAPSSPPKSDEAWRQRIDRFTVEPGLSMRQNSSPIDVGKLIGVVSRHSEVAHEANGRSSSRRVGSEPPCSPPRFRGADAGEGLFNMKTAKRLGLGIPPAILARADEAIQPIGAPGYDPFVRRALSTREARIKLSLRLSTHGRFRR